MTNFLHTNIPDSILISIGPLNIYYYGVLIVIGILLGIIISVKLASYYNISKETVIDSAFYLIIFGLLGGRLYHIFLELPYYIENPLNIFKIWQGGLAIHGGIIAGIIATYYFAKKNRLSPILLASIYAPALALAQAVGRWGNYFNQELYGVPTDLPWGIPIQYAHRISSFTDFEFFHPTFLYESIGNFVIFLILILAHYFFLSKKKTDFNYIIALLYLVLYSVLRFVLEFIRIDKTPDFFGLRVPQIASIIIIIAAFYYLISRSLKNLKCDRSNR